MSDLAVERFNIVTVHSNGETYDDLRVKPNGEFCRYREANFAHKEIINQMSESPGSIIAINQELLEACLRMRNQLYAAGYEAEKGSLNPTKCLLAQVESAIAKALGQ